MWRDKTGHLAPLQSSFSDSVIAASRQKSVSICFAQRHPFIDFVSLPTDDDLATRLAGQIDNHPTT